MSEYPYVQWPVFRRSGVAAFERSLTHSLAPIPDGPAVGGPATARPVDGGIEAWIEEESTGKLIVQRYFEIRSMFDKWERRRFESSKRTAGRETRSQNDQAGEG